MRALVLLVAAHGLLPAVVFAQNYRFPIELSDQAAPYITAYRDLDDGGGLLDWNCGSHTYNGHRGTDIGIGGFSAMDNGSRWVVAAAPGQVTGVVDGCFDRCTTADCECGAGFGNYVKVTHPDGKSTYYAHLMKGSVQVSLGEQVACGQRLGKVGSSGYSTGPHLHFEPRYASNVSDDPYSGPCGGPISWWVEQGPYNGLPGDLCEGAPEPEIDDAAFVSETLPDGTEVEAGATFEKSWTLENTGNTTWTADASYLLAFDGGERFGGPEQALLDEGEAIEPGQQKTFTLTLTAPWEPGTYRGYWRMDRYGVARFGDRVWVEVVVVAPDVEDDAGSPEPPTVDGGLVEGGAASDGGFVDGGFVDGGFVDGGFVDGGAASDGGSWPARDAGSKEGDDDEPVLPADLPPSVREGCACASPRAVSTPWALACLALFACLAAPRRHKKR